MAFIGWGIPERNLRGCFGGVKVLAPVTRYQFWLRTHALGNSTQEILFNGGLLGGPDGIQLSLPGAELLPASWFNGLPRVGEGRAPSSGFLLW